MTLRPPQPPQSPRSLDAEERALAKSLPCLHGRTAPGPDLDASILAAAQAAVRPATAALGKTRPQLRWIAPASLAASLVLAVGMAWQLRPLPRLESAQPAVQSDSADMAAVQMIEPAPMMQSKPASVPAQSAVAERQLAAPPVVSPHKRSPAPLPPPSSLQVYAPPPAPPAPPAPAIAADAPSDVGTSAKSSAASSGNTLGMQTMDAPTVDHAKRARMAAPAAAPSAIRGAMEQEASQTSADKDEILERTQQTTSSAAASAPVIPKAHKEARNAADAGFVDDPEQYVPPAMVDSPAVRDAWLHRIVELLDQGKPQEAKASLAEFRRRYPTAELPARLRALEIEP